MKQYKSLLAFMLFTCLSGCSSPDTSPTFDKYTDSNEKDVLARFGMPKYTLTEKAERLRGELRKNLRDQVQSGKVLIKELYYLSAEGETIFWLAKKPNGVWEVISDVYIPKGRFF